jgi:hypothetical protein
VSGTLPCTASSSGLGGERSAWRPTGTKSAGQRGEPSAFLIHHTNAQDPPSIYSWLDRFEDPATRKSLVQDLHLLKTQIFMDIIEAGQIPLRPGVLRVVDEAIATSVPLVRTRELQCRLAHLAIRLF